MSRRLADALVPILGAKGLEAEVVDLTDYPMPLYHGDEEAEFGPPAGAVALHDRIARFDGIIFVSPEYNGGPTALLKNSFDWVTRVDRAVFKRLLVGLAATSPGSRGARNGLSVMRSMCEHMRLDLVPDDLSIPDYRDAFGVDAGVPTLVRSVDIDAAQRFAACYAQRMRERPAVRSSS
jgi:chromate reductase